MSYATADGTALAGTNYTATSGTLTFARRRHYRDDPRAAP